MTQTWLDVNDFEYDELIVVDRPQSKARVAGGQSCCFWPGRSFFTRQEAPFCRQVCHLTPETILVDDFTHGHEKEVLEFLKAVALALELGQARMNATDPRLV